MRNSATIREEMYRHRGRWRYANKPGDPEACESLQRFLCQATPDSDAVLEMYVVDVDDEACVEWVRCNGTQSHSVELRTDLEILFDDQIADALFAWP